MNIIVTHLHNRFLRSFVLLCLLLSGLQIYIDKDEVAFASPEATTIRVAPTGTDATGCGSEASPCRTIQYAVNKAASGDTILVAGGNYTYQSATDTCTFLVTRAAVCDLNKHLTILGGYSTSNWNSPDPVANLTVVDGGNSKRGVAIVAYNGYASLRMEGFTIQNGLAQGNTSGGDFYIDAAGGGMWSQGGAVTLRNIIFKNNRAIGGNTTTQYGGAASGGGLAIHTPRNGAASTLEHVTFENNQSLGGTGTNRGGIAYGGGMYTYQATFTATDISFTNNLAQAGNSSGNGTDTVHGLRADALGGAAGFGNTSSATFFQVTATGNRSIGGNAGTASNANGGGGFGGAFHAEDRAVMTLNDAQIRGNSATGGKATNGGFAMGGGIMTDGGFAYLDRVLVIGNSAISGASHTTSGKAGQPGGGGIYLATFDVSISLYSKIVNTVIAGNRVELGTPGTNIGGAGAGMTLQALTADVIHSTIADNIIDEDLVVGQAISIQGMYGESGVPAVIDIENSIIANHIHPNTTNTSAVSVMRNSTVNFQKGIFSNNTNNTNSNGKPFPPGTINGLSTMTQVSNPQFVSPGTPNYNYHLVYTSPAINQANSSAVTTDIDGESRPYQIISDIGADEYSKPSLLALPDTVVVLVDTNDVVTKLIAINVNNGPQIAWTANTSGSWLYLGSQGNSQQATGQTGQNLLIWIKPENVELGNYTQNINITGPDVDPETVVVQLVKVAEVHEVYLPNILR